MSGIDKMKNQAENAKGKVKEAVGSATDDDSLKAEGEVTGAGRPQGRGREGEGPSSTDGASG